MADFIPHPLCINPRWAASYLIRAIARGIGISDVSAVKMLNDIADQFSQSKEK